MTRSRLALAWISILVILFGWLIWRLGGGPAIDTNLMNLLPSTEQQPAISEAAQSFRQNFEKRVLFVVSSPEADVSRRAGDWLLGRLENAAAFEALQLTIDGSVVEQTGALYLPHRFQLLAERTREQLGAGDLDAFERGIVERYFSPASVLNSNLIALDPFLLLPDFMSQQSMPQGRLKIDQGYLSVSVDGQTLVLLRAAIAGSPFALQTQEDLAPLFAVLRGSIEDRFPGTTLLISGMALHAMAGTERAKTEMSMIGGGAVLGIIALFLYIFRSWRPLVVTLAVIAAGCVAGFAVCVAIFGQVSLLTLVFGASLVGISVDYALHYYCECFRLNPQWSPEEALKHIFPGITLGLITTILGFSSLLLAPFPALNQIAAFSIAGLACAFGSVVLCLPYLARAPVTSSEPTRLLQRLKAYREFWQNRRKREVVAACILAGVVVTFGLTGLRVMDDIRLLQSLDPTLKAEDGKVRDALGLDPASQFFLIEGRDDAELLRKEEALTSDLRAMTRAGDLDGYQAISDMVPSPDRQADNRRLLARLIHDEPERLARIADSLGLQDGLIEDYENAFRQAEDLPPLRAQDWLASPVAIALAHLWLGQFDGQYMSAVSLTGVRDIEALAFLSTQFEGVHFVDQVGALSVLFAEQRTTTIDLTLVAYLIVMSVLQLRYGILGGVFVVLPAAIAAVSSIGFLGLMGQSISLFNIMALLLVLGIGVDYALFFRETGTDSEATMLAIALSAVTSILAFGLLAFSSTAALQAFGSTIMIGISIALLLAPIAGIGAGVRRS